MEISIKRIPWATIFIWTALVLVLVFTVMPLAFMLTSSFMTSRQIVRMPFSWIPETFHYDNYIKALQGNDGSCIFQRNVFNS